MLSFTIRELVKDDINDVRRIHNECKIYIYIVSHYIIHYTQSTGLPIKYGDAFYDKLVSKKERFGFVAVSPLSKVVGVVTVRVREEGGFWSYFSSNKKMIGYVMTVCVLSTFRRKGIASKLLNMLTSYCRKRFEYLKLELHCLQDNIAAITLYKKHGFQNQLALSEFYFFDGTHHDAYYLSQDLIPQRHTTRKEKDQTLVEYIQNRLFSCMR